MNQENRPLIVIDLSAPLELSQGIDNLGPLFANPDENENSENKSPSLWNETIQALVIKRLLEGIRLVSERAYQQNKSLNTLVIIDEAHRLAPRRSRIIRR